MNPEQQAAYVFAQSVSALIEAAGMFSKNLDRARRNEAPAWHDEDFNNLIDKYGISHNGVLSLF